MPLPVIDGVVRASVGGTITGGGRWANTWHFQRSDLGDPDLVSITALHALLMTFYGGVVMNKVPALTTLEAGDYTPLDGTSGAFHLPAGLVGTETAHNSSPPEVAEVLTIRTALRGRQNRGRVYLPAFTSFFFPDGRIHPDVLTEVVAAAFVLQAACVVAGWTNGVASYGVSVLVDHTVTPARRVTRTWTPHFTPLQTYSMDAMADAQRNRKN